MADTVVQFRGTVYENGYGQLAQKVMRDKTIHVTAKAIYAYLVSFAGQDGSAFPSVELMMDELGIKSEGTFYKYRKQLVSAGYISIEQQQRIKGQFYNNVYVIELIATPKNEGDEPHSKKLSTVPHSKISSTVPSSDFSSTVEPSAVKSSTTINRSSQVTDLNNKHKNNKQDVVVQSEEVSALQDKIEQELKTPIASLLPLLAKWVEEYGEEFLIEKARYVGNQGNWNNVVGTFRSAVVNNWDTTPKKAAVAAVSTSRNSDVQDERYANFYTLFPTA